MKKFITICRLSLIGLCLTLFSCQEEDTIPKPIISEGNSNYSIFTDETVEIKPDVTVEGETNYQWLENNKELSIEAVLVYGSEIAGVHNISFTAVNKGGVASAEYSVEIKAIPTPVINVSIPEEGFSSFMNESINISPEINSIREVTYLWVEGDKELSTEKNFSYSFTKKGVHNITLKATNKGGTSSKDFTINVLNSYYKGMFMLCEGNMGNETGVVSFVGEDGVRIDSIYQKANEGEKLGNVTQDMYITKDRIYFIAQNGRSNGGGDRFIEVDRHTLKRLRSTNDGFGSWPTHVVVVSDNKAYFRDGGGLGIFDLESFSVKGRVEGVGAAKQRMIFVNGKAIVAAGKSVKIINPNTDKVEKSFDLAGTVGGVTKGINHCIWVGGGNKIIKIESTNFTIEKEYTLPDGFSLTSGWMGASGLCTNYNNSNLYWKQGTKICKFDTENEKAEVIANTKDAITNANMIYGVPSLNPKTNEVFFGYIKGYGMDYLINGFGSVDATTGATVHNYKDCARFSVGAFFTDNFDF